MNDKILQPTTPYVPHTQWLFEYAYQTHVPTCNTAGHTEGVVRVHNQHIYNLYTCNTSPYSKVLYEYKYSHDHINTLYYREKYAAQVGYKTIISQLFEFSHS